MAKLGLEERRQIQDRAVEAAQAGESGSAAIASLLAGILCALQEIDYKMWRAAKDKEQGR
jgi:hypothetical protein